MAHHREKLHLRAIRQLRLAAGDTLGLEQARAVDGVRHTVRHELEEQHVFLRELAPNDGARMDDAHKATRCTQRRADQRRETLAQEGAHGIRRADVVDDKRSLCLRDASGEPAAERHADFFAEIALESHRRADDELAPLLIEEQHCRGIAL